jgi:hypothetical protein
MTHDFTNLPTPRSRGRDMEPPFSLPEFRKQLVNMANASDEVMDGTMEPVLDIIASNDVVFGVWQDYAEPNGVGFLVIKGENKLRDLVGTSTVRDFSVTAINCGKAEHAEALRRYVATDPTH